MKFNLKKEVIFILKKLEENSYEGYIVGGCVRDIILGLEPKDYDVCTNALPEETMEIFKDYQIIKTGLKHGTITLILNNESYDITTYRTDGEYIHNRRPSNVTFVRNLKEDLSRRDFTSNAMAYNYKDGLIDYFNGQNDIKDKLIVSVGDAKKRFEEDALRILRGLRFASTHNFKIEENTSLAMKECKKLIKNISAERINNELCKILVGDNVEYIFMNYQEVFEIFIPELRAMIGFKQYTIHHKYDVYTHTIKAMVSAPKDLIIRLTLLLHDVGKPNTFTIDENGVGHFYGHAIVGEKISRKILNRLKFDNKTKSTVLTLIEFHDIRMIANRKVVRRWLNKLGEKVFKDLLKVQHADFLGQNDLFLEDKLKKNQEILSIYKEIRENNFCFSLKNLAINGRDLIDIGITNGKDIGNILKFLVDAVIEEKLENNKDELLKAVKEKV